MNDVCKIELDRQVEHDTNFSWLESHCSSVEMLVNFYIPIDDCTSKQEVVGSNPARVACEDSSADTRKALSIQCRLGRFQRVPDSTRFQIENWNRGSTLLKNRVPASVGS